MSREDDERDLGFVVATALAAQMARALGARYPDRQWENFLLAQDIGPALEQVTMREAVRRYQELLSIRQLGDLWKRVKAWISSYLPGLVRGINDTTWQRFDALVREWMLSGNTLGWLEAEAAAIFGPDRASMIAVTEATRAYTEAGRIAADELIAQGYQMTEIWHTNNDGLVCELCGPLNGEPIGEAWERGMGPPAHPNCRCWTTFSLVAP